MRRAPEVSLNVDAVRHLAQEFGEIVKGHLAAEPHNRLRIFELLNAIAFPLGSLLAGCGDDRFEVRKFFDQVIDETIWAIVDKQAPAECEFCREATGVRCLTEQAARCCPEPPPFKQ